ncbi:MAG: hypothetical protein ACRECQ_01125, partial [Burkholderiaceae bacterium]
PQARAEFKCNSPQTRLDRVACEKAAEGPTELRRYIERMRMIDSLHFPDYVDEARASEWAARDSGRRIVTAPVRVAEQPENPGA